MGFVSGYSFRACPERSQRVPLSLSLSSRAATHGGTARDLLFRLFSQSLSFVPLSTFLLCAQFDILERQIPMCLEDFESPLLLFLVSRLVGIHLLYERLFVEAVIRDRRIL